MGRWEWQVVVVLHVAACARVTAADAWAEGLALLWWGKAGRESELCLKERQSDEGGHPA